jgi:hypothetical protein
MSAERLASQLLSMALAAAFLSVGLRGLIGRRPLVYSARWLVGLFAVILLQQLTPLLSDGSFAQLNHGALVSRLLPVLALGVLVVFWFYSRGYVVFGVTGATLHDALRHTLGERGLSHEDTADALHLPSERLVLQLQSNDWGGSASVKVTPARGKPLLRELMRDLKRFFARHPVELRKSVFVMYTGIGVLLMCLAMLRLVTHSVDELG